ncbi:5'/3'-nucleotidase SurE [Pseudolysinimonas sp.]|jgi:5'-nucleotidase|uniref:5'/3'-nucleotidase SurE n=1 Tax=Pseudolysinimonas sp. TaxID=2680009 RepID=UPI00378527E8
MTRALITNDDGIESPGLYALARAAVAAGWEVVVAAPAEEASGSSAAITGTNTIAVTGHTDASTIKVERVDLAEVPGVPAFSVRAAPGLITLLAAHGAFGDPPDVVLSGINRGANLGRVILHSGTAGAALTGGVNDARGLAVSLDVGLNPEHHHWETAATVVGTLLPVLLEHPHGTVFNLNVPNIPSAEGLELREATLAPFGIVQTTMTEPVEGDVRLTVRELPDQPIEGSDAALLALGHATVTNVVAVQESATPVFSGPRRDRGTLHVSTAPA